MLSNVDFGLRKVNMVLGWSADGRRWKWLKPNDSIVPLGAVGEFDTCGVFGAKQVAPARRSCSAPPHAHTRVRHF